MEMGLLLYREEINHAVKEKATRCLMGLPLRGVSGVCVESTLVLQHTSDEPFMAKLEHWEMHQSEGQRAAFPMMSSSLL